ncbi:hypothetical protein [Balnearium lithotrophicum]|nr:hypothetical protein [Balnearium lithotrophicum]
MKERIKNLYLKFKKLPKRKLILYSAAIKLLEVAVSTYLIKKFFLH